MSGSGTIPYASTTTYAYNDQGEVTGSSNNMHSYKTWTWGDDYDLMGKRTTAYNSLMGTATYTPQAAGADVNTYQSITFQTGLAYDVDGNMTQDGTWYYRYDGGNRLYEMERKNATQTLQFTYDYLGRRVRKTVRSGGPSATVTGSTKFVWEGWTMIGELDAGTSQTGSTWLRGYVWGVDFSSASGSAGGAGGLVAVNTAGATYLPVYDSMGNITGYLNASGGSVAAGCEYNAFGQVLVSTGSWTGFPYGFSSQYTDRESGLVYFGKRFYEPWQGRFINRDPIEEAGGLNLYSLTGNSPTNAWDVLGLCFGFTFHSGWGFDSIGWGLGCWDDWFWWEIGLWGWGGGGGGYSQAVRDPVYPDVAHAKAGTPAPVVILDTVRGMVKAGAYDGEALVPGVHRVGFLFGGANDLGLFGDGYGMLADIGPFNFGLDRVGNRRRRGTSCTNECELGQRRAVRIVFTPRFPGIGTMRPLCPLFSAACLQLDFLLKIALCKE